VRKQLDRSGQRVEPKTPQAARNVVLMPALARVLKEHRLRSLFSADGDLVFPSSVGAGLDHSVPRRALGRAMKAAGLDGSDRPKLRWHDLRHSFASLLISQGGNVVFVSRQLGHASASLTLDVYGHQFDAAEHAERASAGLERSFGSLLDGSSLAGSNPALSAFVGRT
jgi:integrase